MTYKNAFLSKLWFCTWVSRPPTTQGSVRQLQGGLGIFIYIQEGEILPSLRVKNINAPPLNAALFISYIRGFRDLLCFHLLLWGVI